MEDEQIEQYKRKAIGMLLRYNDNNIQIEMLQSKIKEASRRTDIENLAVKYDQPSGGITNKVASSVEASLIRKEQEIALLENELARIEGEVERINIALANMPYAQRTLLKMKYIDKLLWKQITFELNYSEDYIRKELKNHAIEMLTGYLFPELSQINLFAKTTY